MAGYNDRNIIFSARKKDKTYRIFCLGGSASAGWPHPPNEIFSAYLQTALETADTTNDYEVINCSAHGFASYRVKRVFDQVLKFQPDAIIIYSGNNEFLEERDYKTSTFGVFLDKASKNLITVRLITDLFNKQVLSEEVIVDNTFLKKVQGKSLELRKDPELFEKVQEHYENSINYMLKKANKKKLPVIIATVPVNLKDWLPNVSYNDLEDAQLIEWAGYYNNGRRDLFRRDYDNAIDNFHKAVKLLPNHAETYFWMANAYEHKIQLTEAINYYKLAKDLDYNPFRAITFFNDIIRKDASKYSFSTLVDLEQDFISNSKQGIPGFDMFLDYVHPTKQGNILIANSIFNCIKENNIFHSFSEKSINISDTTWNNISDYNDGEDLMLQATRFSLCCINHQYKSAVYIGKYVLKYIPDALRKEEPYNKIIEKINDGINAFMINISVNEREIMGIFVTEQEKRIAQQNLKDFYEKWYSFGNF